MRSDEQPAERQANVEAAHHRGGRARTSEDAPVRLLRRLLGLLARSRARSRFMGGAPLQIVAEVAGEDIPSVTLGQTVPRSADSLPRRSSNGPYQPVASVCFRDEQAQRATPRHAGGAKPTTLESRPEPGHGKFG